MSVQITTLTCSFQLAFLATTCECVRHDIDEQRRIVKIDNVNSIWDSGAAAVKKLLQGTRKPTVNLRIIKYTSNREIGKQLGRI